MSGLFNPLAPHIPFRGWRLLGAFRMRHEKHTQSSSIPQALVLPNNAVAAADPMPAPLNSHLVMTNHLGPLKHSPLNIFTHLTCKINK